MLPEDDETVTPALTTMFSRLTVLLSKALMVKSPNAVVLTANVIAPLAFKVTLPAELFDVARPSTAPIVRLPLFLMRTSPLIELEKAMLEMSVSNDVELPIPPRATRRTSTPTISRAASASSIPPNAVRPTVPVPAFKLSAVRELASLTN